MTESLTTNDRTTDNKLRSRRRAPGIGGGTGEGIAYCQSMRPRDPHRSQPADLRIDIQMTELPTTSCGLSLGFPCPPGTPAPRWRRPSQRHDGWLEGLWLRRSDWPQPGTPSIRALFNGPLFHNRNCETFQLFGSVRAEDWKCETLRMSKWSHAQSIGCPPARWADSGVAELSRG